MYRRHFIILGLSMIALVLSVSTFSETFYAKKIDTSQLEEVDEAGSYPVELSYVDENGNTIKEKIYVTVKYRRTVEQEGVHEAIDAYDIEVEYNAFNKMSDENIIEAAHAKAWDTKTTQPVKITSVTKKKKSKYHYEVTLCTENKTCTTINVIEVERPYFSHLPKYYGFSKEDATYFLLVALIGFTSVLLGIVFAVVSRYVVKESNAVNDILFEEEE